MSIDKNEEQSLEFSSTGVKKLAVIDAARGWAILMVIIVHTAGLLPELPWPVRKLTNYGWFGVELFFIASAFTLLLSWHKREMPLSEKVTGFYIHRFLRIAPMYYFGAALYFIIRPPGESFEFSQLLLSMTFVNGWSPAWLPTTDTDWQVVPGGWSISVEFCFYFLFPFLVAVVRNLKHAMVFFVLGFGLLAVAHPLGRYLLLGKYNEQAIDNFLFFWLPNQIGVFGLGFVLYYLVTAGSIKLDKAKSFLGEKNGAILFVVFASVVLLSQIGNFKYFTTGFPWIPTHLLVSVAFVLLLFSLLQAKRPTILFVNPYATRMGEVSFSAYVLHFGVLDLMKRYAELLSLGVAGLSAIFHFLVVLVLVVIVTYALSRITYHFIEVPFIKVGRSITKQLFPR